MNGVISLILASASRPREVAGQLKSLNLPSETAWIALGAAVIVSVLFIFALSGGQPVAVLETMSPIGPWMMTLIVFSALAVMVFGIYWTGRAMGGTGSLAQTTIIMAWFQVLQLAAQIVQVIAILTVPPVAGLVSLTVLLGLLLVLLIFLDVLHDLGGLGRAAFLLLLAIVGVSLGLSLILGLIGISAPGGTI